MSKSENRAQLLSIGRSRVGVRLGVFWNYSSLVLHFQGPVLELSQTRAEKYNVFETFLIVTFTSAE